MFYNIIGFDNYEVDPYNCIIKNKVTGYELKQYLMEYPMISMVNNDGEKKTLLCHRLFLYLLPGTGDIVNHKDGNKLNWNINNLELVTRKQNTLHYLNTIKKTSSNNSGNSKKVYMVDTHTGKEVVFPSTNEVVRFLNNKYGTGIGVIRSIVYKILHGYRKNKKYKDYTFYKKETETNLSGFKPYKKDYMVNKTGKIYSKKVKRLLKPYISAGGYYKVKIHNKNVPVHRIVADVFLPNPNNLPVVDHIDRNKLNNNISNLKWASHLDNILNTDRKIYSGLEHTKTKPIIGYKNNEIVHVFEKLSDVMQININRNMVRKYIRSGKEYKGLFWKEISKEEYINLKEN